MIISLAAAQEPAKKTKKEKKQEPKSANVIDTITVSKVERAADTLYLEQSIVLNKLDSLIQEKQKK